MKNDEIQYIIHPKTLRHFKTVVIISSITLILCLFLCHLDEMVIAEGEIRPYTKETSVKCLFTGTIENVYYKNTDFVNKGDILFSLKCDYETEYLKNLMVLEKLYNENCDSLKNLINIQENTSEVDCKFNKEIFGTDSRYASFVTSYKGYKNDYELKKRNFERQASLYPVVISKQEYENYENDYLQSLYAFSAWIQTQKIQTREEYSTMCRNLDECSLKINQTKKLIDNATCIAPVSGFINEIQNIKNENFILEGTEILKIIPNEANLKCIIRIQNNSISKIKFGQEVFLQIKDLPFTKYGRLKGIVSLIPQDVTESESPYYPVEIDLDKNFLQNWKKEKFILKIGTRTTAKIITDENTIFQKFLQILIAYDK